MHFYFLHFYFILNYFTKHMKGNERQKTNHRQNVSLLPAFILLWGGGGLKKEVVKLMATLNACECVSTCGHVDVFSYTYVRIIKLTIKKPNK